MNKFLEEVIKGGLPVGTKRQWASGEHIKTPEGWKPVSEAEKPAMDKRPEGGKNSEEKKPEQGKQEQSVQQAEQEYKEKGTRAKAFKDWFGDWENDPENASKIRKNSGTGNPEECSPLKVYHGTATGGIEIFSHEYFGRTDEGWFGKGFYFTSDRNYAARYARDYDYQEDPYEEKEQLIEKNALEYELSSKIKAQEKLKEFVSRSKEEMAKDKKLREEYEDSMKGKEFNYITGEFEDKKKVSFEEYITMRMYSDKEKIKRNEKSIKDIKEKLKTGEYLEIKEVYLNSKNPFYIWDTIKGTKEFLENQKNIKSLENKELNKLIEEKTEDIFRTYGAEKTTNLLKSKGYDAFILKDGIYNNEGATIGYNYKEICVFKPNQIKSVKNRGTFDPEEKNINKWSNYVNNLPIAFHSHPYGFNSKQHAIEKEVGGKRHRYLYGVSSGINVDGDGERLTKEAVDGFIAQANSGDILLYAGKHDVDYIDDVGIMTKAQLLANGDWWTEYRLYDESDGVGPVTLERADKMWKQIKGEPPYNTPRQKGFSIEGFIPEDGIHSVTNINGRAARVINKVNLEGVVVVSRPSYKDSVANAVYKALGELSPWKEKAYRKGIQESLASKIQDAEIKRDYHEAKWRISEALDDAINECMRSSGDTKADKLRILFDEYREIMIPILLKAEEVFLEEAEQMNKEASLTEQQYKPLFKTLSDKVGQIIKSLERRVI